MSHINPLRGDMMEKIKTLRGFKDTFGEEIEKFNFIKYIARKYFRLLGYREIELPVLEKTELFVRSIGDTTDIVEKEMFTFTDVGGDSLTLRPEATAGMVRHYLQESLYAKEKVAKLFTVGTMFRHERPQKGRFREFHQIDVEIFGADQAIADAELIWMVSLILSELGVRNYAIEVNSVGCGQCRGPFRDVLVQYFEAEKDRLCEDCLRRLLRNPLRIFDCKNAQCIEVAARSPLLYDHLCDNCKDHFDAFLHYMNEYGVSVNINKRLVRGLDYYTKTVFEITSEDLGAQKAFIAGGRYNSLVEEMGGPATAGIGFAIGVERLAMLTRLQQVSGGLSCFFAYMGERAKGHLIPVMKAFTMEGIALRYSYEDKSLKAQMRHADNVNADFVLILGDEEIEKGIIILRNMRTKEQYELPLDHGNIVQELKKYSHF